MKRLLPPLVFAAAAGSLAVSPWLVSLLLMAAVYLIWAIEQPRLAFAWSLAAIPVSLPVLDWSGVAVRPFELVVLPAALLAILVGWPRLRHPTAENWRHVTPALVFVAYVVVLSLVLPGRNSALEIRRWLSAAMVGWACFTWADDSTFCETCLTAFGWSAVIMAGVSLSQRIWATPFYAGYLGTRDIINVLLLNDTTPVRLANSTFPHFNAAGAYLSILIPVLLANWIYKRTPFHTVALSAAVLSLYLTYSRGAAVATALGALFVIAATIRPSLRWWILSMMAALLALAIVVLSPLLFRSDYVLSLSIGARFLIWRAYLLAWESSPIFGLGPGNAYQAAQFLSPYGGEYVAHSNYLYLAADFGAVGLALATWMVGHGMRATWRHAIRVGPQAPIVLGATGALIALAIHSIFDHTLAVYAYRVGLLALLALAMRTVSTPKDTNVSPAPLYAS